MTDPLKPEEAVELLKFDKLEPPNPGDYLTNVLLEAINLGKALDCEQSSRHLDVIEAYIDSLEVRFDGAERTNGICQDVLEHMAKFGGIHEKKWFDTFFSNGFPAYGPIPSVSHWEETTKTAKTAQHGVATAAVEAGQTPTLETYDELWARISREKPAGTPLEQVRLAAEMEKLCENEGARWRDVTEEVKTSGLAFCAARVFPVSQGPQMDADDLPAEVVKELKDRDIWDSQLQIQRKCRVIVDRASNNALSGSADRLRLPGLPVIREALHHAQKMTPVRPRIFCPRRRPHGSP